MNDRHEKPSHLPRTPVRKRGIERLQHLLDATAGLIGEHPDEDISLAQIAERADVPLPSVYHFFPSRNAAFVSLAQRYHHRILEMAKQEILHEPKGWQEVFEHRLRRTAAFLNSEPAALRLFMGAGVSAEVRHADVLGNTAIAKQRADYLVERFELPVIPKLEEYISISLAMTDGIWALSYGQHRCISDVYVMEAVRACISYLRSYLPEHVSLREPFRGSLGTVKLTDG